MPDMTFRDRILAFAQADLGTEETPIGSNRGTRVDLFNQEAGAPLGSPWCMSYAYFCVHHASLHAGIAVPILRTASCSALYAWAAAHGKLTATPQPGDIGLLKGGPNGHHHAIIVVSGDGPGRVKSLEGNTDPVAGSPEGYGVFARERDMGSLDFVSVT
jgi:CHAP domain